MFKQNLFLHFIISKESQRLIKKGLKVNLKKKKQIPQINEETRGWFTNPILSKIKYKYIWIGKL